MDDRLARHYFLYKDVLVHEMCPDRIRIEVARSRRV